MIRLALLTGSVLLALSAAQVAPAAAASPALQLKLSTLPTNTPPSTSSANQQGGPLVRFVAINLGSASTAGPVTVTDTLPAGLTPTAASILPNGTGSCDLVGQTATCTRTTPLTPGEQLTGTIAFTTAALPDPTLLSDQATLSGTGFPAVDVATDINVSAADAPFDFLPGSAGLSSSIVDFGTLPVTQAGSHPAQLIVDMGLPVLRHSVLFPTSPDGGVRDLSATLPPGVVINPSATSVRCTEAELEAGGVDGCPYASQIGTARILTVVGQDHTPIYNMVPPPGSASSFGLNAGGANLFVHILGGVRAGDYTLSAGSNDIISNPSTPVFGVR
ncbi:MAG: hypothetical protein J2O47_00340, partial [Acidimicrobiaceae bacterium]|nr:hypothetical protein [Acidimicrobiaceae bacterium]